MDRFLGFLLASAAVPLTEESLWSHWSPQVAVNQREAPALIDEMRGIARGAGVPFERIFLLNSLLDLNSFRYLALAENFAGCSTFASGFLGSSFLPHPITPTAIASRLNEILDLCMGSGLRKGG